MRTRFVFTGILFLLTCCPARAGTPPSNSYVAEDLLPTGELFTSGGSSSGSYFVYSPNGGTVSGLQLFVMGTDTLTIGSSGGASEFGVPTRFNALGMMVNAGATARVAAPVGAAGGTIFFTEFLAFAGTGTLVVEPGADSGPDGGNRVIIQDLQSTDVPRASGNRLIVREHATAEILQQNYKSEHFTFVLAGGAMSFADSLTLSAGAIEATSGNSALAVADGLTLTKPATSGYTDGPVVRVTDGTGLTLVRELGGTELAGLTFGDEAELDIQGGGVLTAGTVRFTQDHDLDFTPTQSGTVSARRLEFTTLTDAAGLTWRVSETAAFSGNYTVKGSGNTYGRMEMSSGAVLASDDAADTAITLGTEDAPGDLLVDGASIRAGSGHDFAIRGARVVLTAAPGGAVLDAGAGRLDLSESALLVNAAPDGGVMAFDAAAGIAVGEYEHRAGTVAVNGASSGFVVAGHAAIGGGEKAAKFLANGDAAHFKSGLTLSGNGVLAAGSGGGTVRLGGDLTIAGGAVLDGGEGRLALAAAGGETAPAVRVTGLGNIVRGAVSTDLALRVNSPGMALGLDGGVLETGPVTVERGGIYTVGTGGTIRNSGGGSGGAVFTVARDGALETTSAGLAIEGYDSVVLDGSFTAGWDGTGVAALTADSDLLLGSTATIRFTDELLANIVPGPDAAIIVLSGDDNTITAQSDLSIASMFGSIGMAVSNGTLAVTSISNRIKADFSPDDIALAADNIRSVWGQGQISAELAGLVYAAAVPGRGDNGFPSAGDAADRNTALLRAIANPSGVPVGLDTVEFMNGAGSAEVSSAGLRTAVAVNEQVSGRIRELRGQLQAASGAVASEAALPAAAMDAEPVGGVYFAGLRVWDRQDDSDGFSGYEYDAHGFQLGYDRVLADNIALGASFAYYRGDYMDGGALAHASGIDGYALTAYGVYSREDGFFAAATAGYARFDNDIRELRNDPSSPAGASWAGARYDSGVLALGIDAGFDYNPSDYLTVTPSAGLLYLHSSEDDHDVYLAGVATQRERDVSSRALLFPFRLAGRYEAWRGEEGRLVLSAELGYTFNAMRGGRRGVIDYYGLSASAPAMGREAPRHSFNAGLGVRFVYRCFDFGLNYSFAGGEGYSAHRLAGTIGAVF